MDFNELKKEYLNKYSSYSIEKAILETFSKKDFIDFIKELEFYINRKDYIYNKNLTIKIDSYKKFNLTEMDKYFIETYNYIFNWWEELNNLKEVLSKIKFYYKLNFWNLNKYSKEIDIKNIPIETIIWMYIKLPNNLNKNFKCPLHNDKTASFRIYKKSQSFYCFWCQKWWNVINFISDIENITTKEAYKKIVKLYSN